MADERIKQIAALLQGVFAEPEGLKMLLQTLAQHAMGEEVAAHLGADPHERSDARRGYRNGSKPRKLATRVGELELDIPQVRGCEPYHPSLFAKWQRSERALLVACGEMYFQGVSTRNVRQVLQTMCAGEISSMTVSRIAQELDEKLSVFRARRLDQTTWPYLQIDARYEKVRVNGRVVSQAVLTTIGYDAVGHRHVLDWRVADSESETSWSEVFVNLKDRGLAGVQLIISDAHGGIRAAIRRHFQGCAWQRCQVHFKRQIAGKVSYKQQKDLMKDVLTVFAPQEKSECLLRACDVAAKWEKKAPAAAKMLREDLEDCLSVLSFPTSHRLRLTSTNMAENIMKRLKKRTRVVGVFPNPASCDRLIGAMLLEVHEQWQTEEHCWINMNLKD